MEHRWSPRRPLAVKAIVHSPILDPMRVRIQDIGAGGMRIETQGEMLAANLHVELVFVGNECGILRIHRVPVLIVWTSRNMAGLMFYEMNPRSVVAVLNAFSAGEVAGVLGPEATSVRNPGNALDRLH
ncbi:MAG: PilZ domain-containing protein [Acidiferrobacterales bacterium]